MEKRMEGSFDVKDAGEYGVISLQKEKLKRRGIIMKLVSCRRIEMRLYYYENGSRRAMMHRSKRQNRTIKYECFAKDIASSAI